MYKPVASSACVNPITVQRHRSAHRKLSGSIVFETDLFLLHLKKMNRSFAFVTAASGIWKPEIEPLAQEGPCCYT